MIEKLIVLEDIDPVIFYGVNNANIQLIKALYPKLRIVARGNVLKNNQFLYHSIVLKKNFCKFNETFWIL